MKYLEENNLLSNTQNGFRSDGYTNNAVLDLINFLVNKLDSKQNCLTIFLDVAKAFDTIEYH